MLKAELEERLNQAENKVIELRREVGKYSSQSQSSTKEIERLNGEVNYMAKQMEQISQSVYMALQIKYPDIHHPEFGRRDDAPDCEEKRFLMFIHGLCVNRNYSSNNFDEMTRY